MPRDKHHPKTAKTAKPQQRRPGSDSPRSPNKRRRGGSVRRGGREWSWRKERVEGGADGEGGELLEVADTLYADDTGEFFRSRADAVQDVPLLVEFLEKFGLFVHVK